MMDMKQGESGFFRMSIGVINPKPKRQNQDGENNKGNAKVSHAFLLGQ